MIKHIRNYINSQILELSSHKALYLYGAFLSSTHILTFFFWHNNSFIYHYLTNNAYTLCWPMIPFCEYFHYLSPAIVKGLLYAYLNISIISLFLFLNSKLIKLAYWHLMILSIFKVLVYFIDYRLMGNYHYMPILVSFMYLLIPRKIHFLPILIVFFYFFAGLLKLSNFDWLTGLAFINNIDSIVPLLFLNEEIKLLLCFYVVCLEILGSWFLLCKNTWLRIGFYTQFIIFHIMSYWFVGYFYPAIMLPLISIFLLIFIYGDKPIQNKPKPCLIKITIPGIVFIILMSLGNIIDWTISGHSGLSGEGRLYGLNMYDAHTECDNYTIIRLKNKTIQEPALNGQRYGIRIHCDPYVFFNTVKKICEFYKNDNNFIDLDWSFYSKLKASLEYTNLIQETNVCAKNLTYSSWRKNKWIK